jgi:glycosyltransferase involved in cell wall biosynthesis
MRILSLCPSEVTNMGGVRKNITRITEELSSRGHECTVLCLSNADLPKEDVLNGVRIIRLRSPVSVTLLGFAPDLIGLMNTVIDNIKPDVIHVHEYRSLFTPEFMWFVRRASIPIVFSPHYDRTGYNTFAGKYLFGVYKRLSKFVFNVSDCIIVNSYYTKQIIQEDFHISDDKLLVVPHGVDVLVKKEDVRRTDDMVISLIYVGVITELKGVHFILPALSLLKKRGYKVSLTIVGDGPYKEIIQEHSKCLGVEPDLRWLGPKYGSELRRLISSHNILLLLSRGESYGIVVAEALALGTPCIVSRSTALIEFLDEPGCFGVNNASDAEELANVILYSSDCCVKVGPFSKKIRLWSDVTLDYESRYQELTCSKC